ncbi:overexpressed in colon carcinoma 1 protein isoform X2 [Pseudophryne corroboree]|uniref:overexpressed in colon carcinoma 1 protein isoform X2 n=1 Tax=Pseudophryne corroboree TaxID=495146 RepID=UPI00308206EC
MNSLPSALSTFCTGLSDKGCRESATDKTHDDTPQDDKHRNYGGVYVGLPIGPDAASSSSSKEAQAPRESCKRIPKPASPPPDNVC